MNRQINYAQAILEATEQCMEADPLVYIMGLGVTDPKGIFGTTLGLEKKFGSKRVLDMPVAENGMTGIAIGSALVGMRPILTHQRVDFMLLSLDQIINNAAKWHYMFGGKMSVPLVIRLLVGRGWGQGPQHSQSLQALFAHIPGLKVVMPTTPYDAKGLLAAAIEDNNPVIFIEHRWLHNIIGDVPQEIYRVPLGKAQKLRTGKDLSIVSLSYMTIEALHVLDVLEKQRVSCDLIDLRSVKPIDWKSIVKSVRKTGRLLVLDTSAGFCSVASEIIAYISMNCFSDLKQAPKKLTLPDCPTPTSTGLTKAFYAQARDIANLIGKMLGKNLGVDFEKQRKFPHDVPGDWFKGPF